MAKRVTRIARVSGQPETAVDGINGPDISASGVDGPAADDGIIVIDPNDFPGGGSDGDVDGSSTGEPTARKRRGRKPGSIAGSKKASSLDVNGVESILYSAHAMLAGITQASELRLDKAEANQLAEAISNVSRHYDVAVAQKTIDWGNLLMVCGMVYGTRMMAIRARRQTERKNRPQNAPASRATETVIPGVGAMQDANLFGGVVN